MSAIILQGAALAAHAANCKQAEAHMARLNRDELARGRKIDPQRDPLVWLSAVFETVLNALRRHQLPPQTWMTEEVIGIVIDLCKSRGSAFQWNGNDPQENEPKSPLFWLTPSTDGASHLVRFNTNAIHHIFAEPLLGLLIWRASEIAFERSLARIYDLTPSEVRCLVMGNARAQMVVDLLVTTIARYNHLVWWSDYGKLLERFGIPPHAAPTTKPDLGTSPIKPFTDLPLVHPRTGQKIDVFAGLQPCNPIAYTTIVAHAGELKELVAHPALYGLDAPATHFPLSSIAHSPPPDAS